MQCKLNVSKDKTREFFRVLKHLKPRQVGKNISTIWRFSSKITPKPLATKYYFGTQIGRWLSHRKTFYKTWGMIVIGTFASPIKLPSNALQFKQNNPNLLLLNNFATVLFLNDLFNLNLHTQIGSKTCIKSQGMNY